MKFSSTALKQICLVFLLLQSFSLTASPYAQRFEENYRKRKIFEKVCKDHPTVRVYHDAVVELKYSDLYRFRPGNIIRETRNEMGQLGPVSEGCGIASGALQQVILSPITILASPWILKRHLKLKRIEKVCGIIDDLYLNQNSSKNLDNLLEFMQLSYPESPEVQELNLESLKRVLYKLDRKGEFSRSINGELVDESDFLAIFCPRRILTFEELIELVLTEIKGEV
ncbi:MAG: hypothetical protein HRU09_16685 [Oligoflexales bacterium]|nr:hypothetical protein [Oligoflexales bacterium]